MLEPAWICTDRSKIIQNPKYSKATKTAESSFASAVGPYNAKRLIYVDLIWFTGFCLHVDLRMAPRSSVEFGGWISCVSRGVASTHRLADLWAAWTSPQTNSVDRIWAGPAHHNAVGLCVTVWRWFAEVIRWLYHASIFTETNSAWQLHNTVSESDLRAPHVLSWCLKSRHYRPSTKAVWIAAILLESVCVYACWVSAAKWWLHMILSYEYSCMRTLRIWGRHEQGAFQCLSYILNWHELTHERSSLAGRNPTRSWVSTCYLCTDRHDQLCFQFTKVTAGAEALTTLQEASRC